MSESLLRLCFQASGTALVLLPPALMLVRWVRPRLMPVWLLVCLLIFGGWALANVWIHTKYAHLDELVMQMPDPDISEPDRSQVDGRRRADGVRGGLRLALCAGAVGTLEPGVRGGLDGPETAFVVPPR